MSRPPRIHRLLPAEPEVFLRRIGVESEESFDLAEAALALAQIARPELSLTPYRRHLVRLAERVTLQARSLPDTPSGRLGALIRVLVDEHGYQGDRDTYDDLGNADLARVIDRRRGLPVALGILYIATARAQGWTMTGLNTPGHFLVRLEADRDSLVADPFSGRKVIQDMADVEGAEPDLSQLPTADDRAVLLRLQNNIKTRLLNQERYVEAEAVLERMLWIAPEAEGLWWESALVNAHEGNLGAAIKRIDGFLDLSPSTDRKSVV